MKKVLTLLFAIILPLTISLSTLAGPQPTDDPTPDTIIITASTIPSYI